MRASLVVVAYALVYTSLAAGYNTQHTSQLIFQAEHDYHLDNLDEIVLASSTNHADVANEFAIKTRRMKVFQPKSVDLVQQARRSSPRDGMSSTLEWTEVEVNGPDVQDRHTLAQLGRMTGNAYAADPDKPRWYDLDPAWNNSFPIGWEDSADGFRGHVFRSSDNSTVVLAIKGTTLNGPTSKKDKFNDNLLFSCCCARVDIRWALNTVCGCYSGHNKCDATCLADAMIEDSLFYSTGTTLVTRLQLMYPSANLWLVGHSLGGALASLLGATFGLPAVAFEAPGEKSAARHLNLPIPNNVLLAAPVTHVYHTADPIAMGVCNGALSPCAQAGYALETRCHLGKSIVFDTVAQLGWKSDVRKHPIKEVILKVLEDEREWEDGRQVPLARPESGCFDCTQWEYDDFKHH